MSIINVQSALEADVLDRLRMSNYDVQIYLSTLYDRTGLERRLEQIPGVEQVEGWAQTPVQRVRPTGDRSETFTVYGLPYNSIFIDPLLQSGQWLQPPEGFNQNDIVVTTELLHDESDIQLGDIITLELNYETEEWRVVGILVSSSAVAYAHFDDLSHFMKLRDKTAMLSIRTTQHDAETQYAVSDAIRDYLDLRDIWVVRSTTYADLAGDTRGGLTILISVLIGMAILVAAVGGLGLAGTMSLNVLERTREIGVMRAVGASTGTVRGLFIFEGIIIGVLSAVVALPLSVPGSVGFGNILGEVIAKRPLPYAPTLEGPASWLVIIIVISATASLMPAQRATQISVREALAYE
jgi:putative ABC transport system permease protein